MLQLERSVHQVARLKSIRSLRLEATLSAETNLPEDTADEWIVGTSRLQNPQHFSQLLKQGVIDAWLTSWSASERVDDELAWIPLWKEPDDVGLMVQRDLLPFVFQAPGPGGSDSTSPINHQLIP